MRTPRSLAGGELEEVSASLLAGHFVDTIIGVGRFHSPLFKSPHHPLCSSTVEHTRVSTGAMKFLKLGPESPHEPMGPK